MKTRIAIVGLGKIATDQHVPALSGNDEFELVATVSSRGLASGGLPTYRTPPELYRAHPEVSAVAVCTPPGARHAIVREALEAGRDVLMEKPPTRSLAEFRTLVDQAAAAGRVLFQTWHSRFNAAVDEARAILAREGVASLRIDWRENVHRWHPGQDWIWEPGGFGVFDPGVNALSILSEITPYPVMVERARFRYLPGAATPVSASLAFKSNEPHRPPMTGEFDWLEGERERWTVSIVTCAGTALEIGGGGSVLIRDDSVVVDGRAEEYPRIYQRFAGLLRDRRSEADDTPLRLVVDAFMVATHDTEAPPARGAAPA